MGPDEWPFLVNDCAAALQKKIRRSRIRLGNIDVT